jgi:2-oxoglutarate/2-oxoacid ferredoxin oxidoreductase subunit beta
VKKVFSRPKSLKNAAFHYCAGCGHSIVHRLICEVIDEMGLQEKTIGVPPAGCSVIAYNYFDVDMVEAAHGRSTAVATGIKRACPEAVVFSYQGDGDMAAIGTAESIHTANRGEKFTAFFINNAVYGMTGGQMAPTTLPQMITTTTPFGRNEKTEGAPLHMSEMLALTKGTVYIERVAVNSPAHIQQTKRAIRKAFQTQLDGKGFALVEILAPCPTNWKMNTVQSWKWVDDVLAKEFPLGVIKDTTGEKSAD